jgi:hypothetical protein
MEKMYDAGRYMLLCSAGELPPNLQGIWTGSWQPAWSGDFTLDTNVQAAMASACSANLPELMEGYFRLMEGFYPEWRLNAKRMVNTMLLSSRPGQIELLPALPKAWPAGKVTGLRARGGFTVDIAWKDGKVTSYRIASKEPKAVKVRLNGEVITVNPELLKD